MDYFFFGLTLLLVIFCKCQGLIPESIIEERVCIGTNGRWSVPSNRDHHYRNLKNRFTNCTYVDGNLELTWLQDSNFDLSFLQYIREVTGYVLISHVDVRRVVLPSLQIIRGRTLFKMSDYDEEFALIVTTSKMFTVELPALRDILSGSVVLFNNYNLCHVKTINWKEIISDPIGKYVYHYNFSSPERQCAPCHKNCSAGCWGEGVENCQRFSKENCSPQCYQGRCFGSNPRECCHLFCAGGCVGPKQSDCIACKNFYDDGVCTQECPPMQIYNPTTYSWEPNPHGKYAYGATCVKKCPEHLLKDNGACVRTCPNNKKAERGECVSCTGPCPKTCTGDVQVNAGNIDTFKGCTVIEGYLHILENSFTGYQHFFPNLTFGERYPAMHPDRLQVFTTLKEITGFLNIQAYHQDFKNLSCFRNLEVIGGRTLYDYFSSLYIVKTSLESLDLRSLRRINSGTVAILENKHLCFAEKINWKKIKKSMEHSAMLQNNRSPDNCSAAGLVCHEQCTKDGCWGKGPDQCLACANYRLGNMCLQNCSVIPGPQEQEKLKPLAGKAICRKCHPRCKKCTGYGFHELVCQLCTSYKKGEQCEDECPEHIWQKPRSSLKKPFIFQEEKDVVRNLASSMENSGSQSGEEYLQPKSRAPLSVGGLTSMSGSIPSTLASFWPNAPPHTISDGSCSPQNQHNWNQERLRYAKAHGLDPNSLNMGNNSDCSSLQYRDDSLSVFNKEDIGSDEYDAGRSQAQVGSLKLELPVDEDDYLMPSPQQTHTSSTYVDLIGDSSKNSDDTSTNMYQSYADFCKTNIDNPEYLMGPEAACQTLGIPTVSEFVHSNTVANDNNVNSKSSNYVPQKSLEDESDHEYYNDFDRLQRELQPLQQKGETTV
ncbi:hypothetical protein PPYR_10659 [Photinus pyralis]|uniref:receptor protein-tyrosine kinase n=1 Tax=Photinus pyralis TaxID=7054 RepID=A0A5N4AHA0_PHOPY|nr:hypothetical protein PPYR_10659 [Photinus pyralis]